MTEKYIKRLVSRLLVLDTRRNPEPEVVVEIDKIETTLYREGIIDEEGGFINNGNQKLEDWIYKKMG